MFNKIKQIYQRAYMMACCLLKPKHPEIHVAADPEIHVAADPEIHVAADPEIHVAADPEIHIAADPENRFGQFKVRSLSEFLDDLDKTMKNMTMPTFRGSWNSRETRAALKKIGPTAMSVDDEFAVLGGKVTNIDALPTIMYLETNWDSKYSGDTDKTGQEIIKASAFYCIKQKNLPDGFGFHRGVAVYEFGLAYNEKHIKKRLWVCGYAVISSSGDVLLPRTYSFESRIITHKSKRKHHKSGKTVRCNGGRERKECIRVKCWSDQQICSPDPELGLNALQSKERIISAVGYFINVWGRRRENWLVSVRDNKNNRATFVIDKADPKVFFADRDISAVTPSGHKKRIIHYVAPHIRLHNGVERPVVGHLRGERSFRWRDYSINVTAPDLHVYNSDCFTLAGTDEKIGNTIGIKEVASVLAGLEDDGQQRRKAA